MRAVRPAAGANKTELPSGEEEWRINAVPESISAVRGLEPPRHRPFQIPSFSVWVSALHLEPPHPTRDPAPWPQVPGASPPCCPWVIPSSEDRNLVPNPRHPVAVCRPQISRPWARSLTFSQGIDSLCSPGFTLPIPIQAGLYLL